MKYWRQDIECIDREELVKLQSRRLSEMVKRIYHNVPFYKNLFDQKGINPNDIKDISQLNELPFTTKKDLRDNYPFGLFAVPQSEVVRLHASSGTTGKPTVVGCTKNDLEMWSEVVARSLTMAGITNRDIMQVAYGYGLFTGGLGIHYGVEKVGASVIPISTGNTKKQLQLMMDFGSTAIACTPSYLAYLAESIEENGVKDKIKLKRAVCGAEPWSEELRRHIQEILGIKAFNIYGLSEVIGPGVAMECECQNGSHIHEDHFVPEIINPETGDVLPYGEVGELVFTTLTKEAMPLLRYRTRDLCTLNIEKCECGRTLVRMGTILGRSDDMLIIRGVNVFPSQVESVLMDIYETTPNYVLTVDRKNNLDTLEIKVEIADKFWTTEIREIENLKKRIAQSVQSTLGISAVIKLAEPHTLSRSEGKAVRVIDNRKK
ncbi:MAG: phenylacetate--CoA ligase [Muribaculaceae bacterium]|nr:phenylacetate--CoA ligase [Muribaculaceae bacterium]